MLTFYLEESHKTFAGLISGGAGVWNASGKLISVKNSECQPLTAGEPISCDKEEIALYAHSSGDGEKSLSVLSDVQVAMRLNDLYAHNKSRLKDIYLIACEAGLSVNNSPSLAQRLARELVVRGFSPDIRVHAIAAPMDRVTTDIRIQAVENSGLINRRRRQRGEVSCERGDIYAFTVKVSTEIDAKTKIQTKIETEEYSLTPPTPAQLFQPFWNLPHNTFTALGPEYQTTILSMQIINRLIKKRYAYEADAKSTDEEKQRKGEKYLQNLKILIGRLQYQHSRKEIQRILNDERTRGHWLPMGKHYEEDIDELLKIVADYPADASEDRPAQDAPVGGMSVFAQKLEDFFQSQETAFLRDEKNQGKHLDQLYRLKAELLNTRPEDMEEKYCNDEYINSRDGEAHKTILRKLKVHLQQVSMELQSRNEKIKELSILLSDACFKNLKPNNRLLEVIAANQPSVTDDEKGLVRKITALTEKRMSLLKTSRPKKDSSVVNDNASSSSSSATTPTSSQWTDQRKKIFFSALGSALLLGIGIALIATGVLAPFGIAVFGVHAALYSGVITAGIGALVGALLGWGAVNVVNSAMESPGEVNVSVDPAGITGSYPKIMTSTASGGTVSAPKQGARSANTFIPSSTETARPSAVPDRGDTEEESSHSSFRP